MARFIFYIDLDAFFVSVEQVLNPELKEKPVIVGGDPERRGLALNAGEGCFWKEGCLREGRRNLSPKVTNYPAPRQ
jgi:hypothetical protein